MQQNQKKRNCVATRGLINAGVRILLHMLFSFVDCSLLSQDTTAKMGILAVHNSPERLIYGHLFEYNESATVALCTAYSVINESLVCTTYITESTNCVMIQSSYQVYKANYSVVDS